MIKRISFISVIVTVFLVAFSASHSAFAHLYLPARSDSHIQQAGACPGFSSRLTIGQMARVTSGLSNNVRKNPSLAADQIGQIQAGEVLQLLGGPRCTDDITWWKVDYAGLIGWTGEGRATTYWLEPYTGPNGAAGALDNSLPETRRTPPDVLRGITFSGAGGGMGSSNWPICPLEDSSGNETLGQYRLYDSRLVLRSFQPFERVALISKLSVDADDYIESFFQTDSHGQFDGVVDTIGAFRLVGDAGSYASVCYSGASVSNASTRTGYVFTERQFRDFLYAVYWNNGRPETSQCSGFMKSRLTIGDAARVTPGLPNRLRSGPDLNQKQTGTIPGGSAFQVIYGPECTPDGSWWLVDYDGLIGWTLEGNQNEYWLEPVN